MTECECVKLLVYLSSIVKCDAFNYLNENGNRFCLNSKRKREREFRKFREINDILI